MIGFDTCCSDDNGENTTVLGKIKLTDTTGTKFGNLADALAYVQEFTTAPITETSFADGIFYFTVPANTAFLEKEEFCSDNTDSAALQFEDPFGLVTSFDNFAFYGNQCNNVCKNAFFKSNSFDASSGKNKLDNCQFLSDNCFENSIGGNKFFSCSFLRGYYFTRSEGNNCFYDCSFGSDNPSNGIFEESKGDNTFDLCRIYNDNAFAQSTGRNKFTKFQCYGAGFFSSSYGNNDFDDISEFNGEYAFELAEGNNTFGNKCYFKPYAFADNRGNNTFGDQCDFGYTPVFLGARGNNTFGNDCNFEAYSFIAVSGINNFGNNCTFGDYSFTGNGADTFSRNYFGANCSFANYCFTSTNSENFILSANFGVNCFENAEPATKNTIGFIITANVNFAYNYKGRFDFLQDIPGAGYLPADIFNTSQIVSIHYPNIWNYNNAGGPAQDLLTIQARANNLNNSFIYD